jgi:uncharacterized damage-inducible protein DinB
MKANEVLQGAFGGAHGILAQQMADCSSSALQKTFDNSTIFSIGSIYAHVIYSEDAMINGMLQGKPPLWVAGGYAAKSGINLPQSPRQDPEWAGLQVNPARLADYADAVKQSTASYLSGLSDADLDRKVQAFGREQPVADVLANILLWHVSNHSGEIAALKGIQGLKGLPF